MPILNTIWERHHQTIEQECQYRQHNWAYFYHNLSLDAQTNLKKVGTISLYACHQLAKHFDYFTPLISSGQINHNITQEEMAIMLADLLSKVQSDATFNVALRIFRQKMQTHIIWLDLLRINSSTQTMNILSAMADLCINAARNYYHHALSLRYGLPISDSSSDPQPLIILAMGKLGAAELNLSSDIDLIFFFPQEGYTQTTSEQKNSISNQEFFIKLGQKIIQSLDTKSSEGFVYRTDMRLRPYGESGPLVMSYSALSNYYHEQGREWERYAMIKARIVNTDQPIYTQQLIQILNDFTYRKYIDYSALESLRDMKRMIRNEIRQRGLEHNIKLGEGGIRDIEFLVQSFQLVRGGQDLNLQRRELLPILSELVTLNLIDKHTYHELKSAYLFLRDTEHVLQSLNDEQTQLLPEHPDNQERVRHGMQFPSWDEFLYQLNQHRHIVSQHFNYLVDHSSLKQTADTPASTSLNTPHTIDTKEQHWQTLWTESPCLDIPKPLTLNHSKQELDQVSLLIQHFRESKAIQSMQGIGRDRLNVLMPLLLKAIWHHNSITTTLQRILSLLESISRRTVYLVLLTENPEVITQLVLLCHASPWLSEYISQSPLLLDELHQDFTPQSKRELQQQLQQMMLRIEPDDLEEQMNTLRHFKKIHTLKAAASELTQKSTLKKTSDYLTHCADVILETTHNIAWHQMVQKYGSPTDQNNTITQSELIIIGYGKIGGHELSYSSDLDLVFLYHTSPNGMTDGKRSIHNSVFYTRLGQRMIHILNTRTRAGQLYEVDMRLRPSGSSGMIATSIYAFEKYQKNTAWTWEHQALIRARVIDGSPTFKSLFESIRVNTLTQKRKKDNLAHEVSNMRAKMITNLGSKNNESTFHLKHDKGGIVDIEFIVQYCVLGWAHKSSILTQPTDNIQLLDAIEKSGLISTEDRIALQDIYIKYRTEAHRRALQNELLALDDHLFLALKFDSYRNTVIRIWNHLIVSC
jgi:glutamate-ammonia-ligase adenylyltransferase